jgi:hypothetical protein
MNKKEFISYLENRLNVLNKAERDDIINEYVQHIDNKIEEGLTEKDAVKTFGNIEDMVREILSAYNVDPDYSNRNNSSKVSEINDVVTGSFGKFANLIKNIGDYILGQKATTLLKFIIKSLVLFFVLLICFMIGYGLSEFFVNVISSIIGRWNLVDFIIKIVYIVIALPTVIYIFVRFLAFNIHGGIEQFKNSDAEENLRNKAAQIKEKISIKRESKESGIFGADTVYNFENIMRNIICFAIRVCWIMFKVFIIMCLIPCLITVLFTIIAFGGMFVFMLMGYPLIGATIGCLGFNISAVAVLVIILKVMFFNKREEKINEEVL